MSNALRILIVDDSLLFRKVIRDALNGTDGCEVVGVCGNGSDAIQRIEFLKPDLVTLDIEMPGLNGLEVLKKLSEMGAKCGVLMLSNLTSTGARQTNRALELGAFDFVLKPQSRTLNESVAKLKADLIPRVNAFAGNKKAVAKSTAPASPAARQIEPRKPSRPTSKGSIFDIPGRNRPKQEKTTGGGFSAFQLRTSSKVEQVPKSPSAPKSVKKAACTRVYGPAKAVAIGISTGGPKALMKLLPELPAKFPVPVFVVQHMPPVFTKSLAESLNPKCRNEVCEAANGMVVRPGTIYIAPGGKQMKVVQSDRLLIEINNDPPENSSRPSVDYLFRNLEPLYKHDLLAVVMTGMGNDGTSGAGIIKQSGGRVYSQDEASSTVFGMPKAVFEAGFSDCQYSLDEIGTAIKNSVRGVSRSCV